MKKILSAVIFFMGFYCHTILAIPKTTISAQIKFDPRSAHQISFRIYQGYWATVAGVSTQKATEVLPPILAQVPPDNNNLLEFGFYNPTTLQTTWFPKTCLFTLGKNTLSLNLLITNNQCRNLNG